MLQFLRLSLGDGGVEQCQMHRQIGIFVYDIHKRITNGQRYSKLFYFYYNIF